MWVLKRRTVERENAWKNMCRIETLSFKEKGKTISTPFSNLIDWIFPNAHHWPFSFLGLMMMIKSILRNRRILYGYNSYLNEESK